MQKTVFFVAHLPNFGQKLMALRKKEEVFVGQFCEDWQKCALAKVSRRQSLTRGKVWMDFEHEAARLQ